MYMLYHAIAKESKLIYMYVMLCECSGSMILPLTLSQQVIGWKPNALKPVLLQVKKGVSDHW